MDRNAFRIVVTGFAGLVVTAGSVFSQGTLTPSAGPERLFKTLQQVEPRTPVDFLNTPGCCSFFLNCASSAEFAIREGGSYYLVDNIEVEGDPGGGGGIGLPPCITSGVLIDADNVTLDLNGFAIIGASNNNHGVVIAAGRKNITIRNGHISGMEDHGINAQAASCVLIEDVTVSGNQGDGVVAGNNGMIHNVCATDNGGRGIVARFGFTISHSYADNNGDGGILASNQCVVTHCVSRRNSDFGIRAQFWSKVENCAATDNDTSVNGIIVREGCLVKNCVADSNGGSGISTDPFAVSNLGGNYIIENMCKENTGPGINVQSQGNRVDGNSLIRNFTHGIQIAGTTSNLVIRNQAAFNLPANYSIAAGNQAGTTLSTPLGSDNPWANFSQ